MELDCYLPFHRIGFACNPFSALSPDEIGGHVSGRVIIGVAETQTTG
jgi:hypothetical protein